MTCPVTGLPCNKFKEFRITEINDGKVVTLDLCRECMPLYLKGHKVSKEGKVKIEAAVSDFVQAIGNLLGILAKPTDPTAGNPCPKCGATLQEISSKQKIGCAVCYDHFSAQLGIVVARCQGGTKHVGKVPKKWAEKNPPIVAPMEYIAKQKEKLDAAIKSEDYEQAATIRDKLVAVEALRDRLDAAVKDQDFEQASLLRSEIGKFTSRD
jgi:protein arginine kinase activator